MTAEVTVVDYGVGNILSVERAFIHVGAAVEVTSDPQRIVDAKRLVLPGVGAFAKAMETLSRRGCTGAVLDFARTGRPFLGICLGMQMMFEASEEFGRSAGLGLIPGVVSLLPDRTTDGVPQRIPNIGWLPILRPPGVDWSDTPLRSFVEGSAVYFVHSFAAPPGPHTIAYCPFGGHAVTAIVRNGNLFGCQFHPEKSSEAGLGLLRAFLDLA